MKKSFLALLLSSVLLFGCNAPKGEAAESSSAAASSSEVSSSSSSQESSSSEPAASYTVKGVMEDICTAFFGSAVEDEDYFSDGEGGYYTGANFGAYGEEYLEMAVETVISYLPDYCVEVFAPVEDTWEDGDPGYFAGYCTDDESVNIQIGSYIYSGSLCAQVNVY